MTRVLCCIDDSAGAVSVVQVARQLSDGLGLELVLVHVAPHSHAPGVSAAVAGRERLLEEERNEAEEVVRRVAAEAGIDSGTRTRAELGKSGERIVQLCDEEDASFVVMGSRGRGGLKAAVLGSTSLHVAGNAPCPCVIVPASATTESESLTD